MEVFPKKKRHLEPLTSMRFVAAYHVVVYHAAFFIEASLGDAVRPIANFLHTGYTGVNLFFLLSGFILAYTYLSPDETPRVDTRRFWVARVARVYPVYLLSLLLVAPKVVAHFFSTNEPAVATAKLGVSLSAALGLLQAWIPPLRPIWNFPSWTLSVEAFFYALFPFVALWIWRLGRGQALTFGVVVWLVGLLPATVGILLLPPEVGETMATERLGGGPIVTLLRSAPLVRLPEFLLGIALARAFFPRSDEAAASDPFWTRVASAGAVFFAVGLAAALLLADRIPRLLVHAGILDPIYGGLIVCLAHCRGWVARFLSLRPFVVLGEASYGVYILHIPALTWLMMAIGTDEAKAMGFSFFLLYSFVVVGGSILVYSFYEEPARIWIRRRLAPRSARATEEADLLTRPR